MILNELAVRITKKLLYNFEDCILFAYPDPSSDLYKALSEHGMLPSYLSGKTRWKDLPDNFKGLSGAPFTCGVGETNGVTKNTVYTAAEADAKLDFRVRLVMTQALTDCPALAKMKPECIAACTSLAYNVGSSAFKNSTAAKQIAAGHYGLVPDAMKMWNKSAGKIVQGLVNRRKVEADLFKSGV
jgi:lysozyme